ncbi:MULTISPECIES: metalloprotease PmbA [Shewanella]|uniref:Metalloprotease PmbA n=1 Tax=Shewanella fidelis TaxID=173509 RepID=A0AAW8NGC2_9GAMM|nr:MULTISPECIES: metalloprotease PmbA [Shewanella]MDR8522178.1 metalloprotease PmbA [Shewanella fidelis]MDW4812607.1 metalloprotease PmbA [Shewanella fidelis]MDW4816355.1 metalloprotease PmbA [Shewanella fidelis]MDW4820848.1 metalloprotease PmbA [Shewanella fidelis]MDW4825071.1 metalloprotease PmbA [Shewanella fidelis]
MSSPSIDIELDSLKDAVSMALEYAKTLGTSGAEVAISKQQGLSVSTRMKEVETVEFNKDGALGITVFRDGCKGSSSTSDLSKAAIEQAVKAADDIARFTSADPFNGLAEKSLMATEFPDLDLYHPEDISPEELTRLAVLAEEAALDTDKRVQTSDGASANAHSSVKVYGNSHGFLNGFCSSRYSLSCVAIGEHEGGMQRDYDYTVARKFSDMTAPEIIGRKAAEKTAGRLGGRKIATTQLPVLFSPEIATGLMGHLVGAISGGSLYRKSSFLLDAIDTQVFPDWFSIHEDPLLVGALASSAYDSEGVATQARDIIDNGRLATYLLTSYSARKLGLSNTGHAGGIYNWTLSTTGQTFDQLVKEMGTGLIVTEVMGQGVNTVTGDYSRGAAGFYVENGVILYPVEEITIAGNLKDMYKNIVAVAKDRDLRSSIRTGGILMDKMKIAGN